MNTDTPVNSLGDIFCIDAKASHQSQEKGLVLDESQKSVIEESWHTDNPMKLSALRETYRQNFPVNEESKEVLNVPTLDDSVESMLVKKYGHKAGFSSTPSLYGK